MAASKNQPGRKDRSAKTPASGASAAPESAAPPLLEAPAQSQQSTAGPGPDPQKMAGDRRARFQAWRDALPVGSSFGELVDYISNGGHLAGFCKEKDFAYVTVMEWIYADSDRSEMYARARVERSDLLADEIVAISDEACVDAAAVARNKLRVDSRKWIASKLKPRQYGDKLELEGKLDTGNMSDAALVARLVALGVPRELIPLPAGNDEGTAG